MFANAKALLVIVSCALVAQAQSTSGTATAPGGPGPASPTGGLDPCILNCVNQSLSTGGCTSATDLSCVCTSTAFQQAVEACLKQNCTPADLQTAAALQQQECGSMSSMSSGTATSTGTSSPSASPSLIPSLSSSLSSSSSPSQTMASTSGSATPSSTSNAAMALIAPLSLGGIFGTVIASAGALVGAAFVL